MIIYENYKNVGHQPGYSFIIREKENKRKRTKLTEQYAMWCLIIQSIYSDIYWLWWREEKRRTGIVAS